MSAGPFAPVILVPVSPARPLAAGAIDPMLNVPTVTDFDKNVLPL